ncbi:hypothetical protein JCM11641_005456 [Rhodosporidiobolus odoratus]
MRLLALLALTMSALAFEEGTANFPIASYDPQHTHSLEARAATTACTNGFSAVRSSIANRGACECRAPKVITADGSSCVVSCPDGSYKGTTGACVSCPSTFATCSDSSTALSCSSGFFLSGSSCVQSCGLNTYPTGSTCVKCADADAAACSNDGRAATACMTKFLSSGACVDADAVPDGYYADATTNTFKACDAGIKTCIGSGDGMATSCGLRNGAQLVLTLDGNCAARCTASNQYLDARTNACIACDSTALTCNAAGAITCGKDNNSKQLYLTPTKKCILPQVGYPGYWADSTTFTFVTCDDGVTSCLTAGAGNALTCGKRADGTALYWTAASLNGRLARRAPVGGSCVAAANCPAATWANPSTSLCTACDDDESACSGNGAGSALSCKSGLFLTASHDCVTSQQCKASGAFFPDAATRACSNCDDGEAACTANGLGFATACAKNANGDQLFLYQGNCVPNAACPTGYFGDLASKACQKCDAGALTCTGYGAATSCGFTSARKRLYLDNGKCVLAATCSSGTWAEPVSQVCQSCKLIDEDAATCTSPTVLSCNTKFFYQSACIDPCPDGYYGNTNGHVCSPCLDSDAATCGSNGMATRCKTKNLFNGNCLNDCPAGTVAKNQVCVPCTSLFGAGAATCSLQQTLSCNAGYVWWNNQYPPTCISESSCYGMGPYYPKDGTCSSCTAVWPYAATCNAGGPTSCSSGRFVDAYNRCSPHCANANGFKIDGGKNGYSEWYYNYYIDGSQGAATVCSQCEYYSLACDLYTGKTTKCNPYPYSKCTNV